MPFSVLSVRERIVSSGFLVLRTRQEVKVTRKAAERFYEEHKRSVTRHLRFDIIIRPL